MILRDKMVTQGNWLFRWRGLVSFAAFLPLIAIVFGWDTSCRRCVPHWVWQLVCVGVSCLGVALRVLTAGYAAAGTSGRNTKHQRAAVLNTTGAYSLTRNPLYLGNFLMMLGVAMLPCSLVLLVVYAALYGLYYERIILAEEAFLLDKFKEEFVQWAGRTPAFWPRLRGWNKPGQSFSLRPVLKREHGPLTQPVTAFILVEQGMALAATGRPYWDWVQAIVLATVLLQYAVLRSLKKFTHVLKSRPRLEAP